MKRDTNCTPIKNFYKQMRNREILFVKNNMLIVDEVHNLRNLNLKSEKQGKRSKAVLKCATKAQKRLLLTATPFVNDLTDFIPIVNYLYGKIMIQTKGDASTVKKLTPYLEDRVHFISVPRESKKRIP